MGTVYVAEDSAIRRFLCVVRRESACTYGNEMHWFFHLEQYLLSLVNYNDSETLILPIVQLNHSILAVVLATKSKKRREKIILIYLIYK